MASKPTTGKKRYKFDYAKLAKDRGTTEKGARFIHLANKRVNKAVKAIQQIGNLFGPGYESTAEQATKIFDVLGHAYDAAEDRSKGVKATVEAFKL